MDFQAIIRIGLEEYLDGLRKALHGLTAAERRFQPKADANHIDFVVWHMARNEDQEIHDAQRTSEVWQRDAWDQKLGLPAGDDGFGYTVEQVASYYSSTSRTAWRITMPSATPRCGISVA